MSIFKRTLLLSSAMTIGAMGFSSSAFAQETLTADTQTASGDIIITARKRAEDILKTPIAVTALTSQDIQARGIVSITDIAANTPGMNVDSNSSGRNDRSFQQIILRGFTPSSQTATPTTSIFIDGVPVSSATALETIDDPARVEILKGPQSAYFGRNTFAGAVNVVTKDPSANWGGSVRGLLGTRSNYDAHADVEGPLLGDGLTFRASARRFGKGGSYVNAANPNQRLGNQQTTSGTLEFLARPLAGLTIKAFGLISQDKDGPSAQGLLSAYTVTNSTGATIVPNQSNCVLTGSTSGIPGAGTPTSRPFFCGTAPGLVAGFSPAQNTVTDSIITNFLNNPRGRLVNPSDGVQGYGLKRLYYHLHLNVDYNVGGGVTLSSLTGYNNEYFSELADLDNYDTSSLVVSPTPAAGSGSRNYFDFPFLVERKTRDFSQELRANYDDGGRLRLTAGGSYLLSRVQGGLGGGNAGLGVTTFSSVSGATKSRTSGIFGSISYDLTDQLTLTVDGRYQIDTLYAYAQPTGLTLTSSVFAPAGFYPGNSLLLRKTFHNFLPRAIAQFKPTPDTMVYASYSKGVNPGQFNTAFLTQSLALQQAAANAGIGIGVSPEKLTNYEVGLKGKLFNGRLRLALAGYYARWTSQINTVSVNALDNNGVIQIVSGSVNAGKLNLKGVEFDATAMPTTHLTFNVSAALNDTDIKTYVSPATSIYTGVFNYRGKENPNTSKYSATVGGEYRNKLGSMTNADWFVRADFIYKSGTYADQANTVKTEASKRVNFRLGVDRGPVALEAFVTNAFNDRAYTSIAVNGVFTPTFAIAGTGNALIVGLPDLRTFGVRGKYSF